MKTVTFESVSKSYNGKVALSEFTLKIMPFERLVLFGPSGCGKTTVLRLLAGLIAPDSGSISIGDALVASDGRNLIECEHRNIGMVFQDLALWPHMSVWENIEFGLRAQHVPTTGRVQRIQEILQVTQMSDYAKFKPSQLSGGQQQRVAIARALVLKPDILLLDEPLDSLDDVLKQRIISEICELQAARKFLLIFVTHDRYEAKEIGTFVVTLRNGRIESTGSVAVL